VKAWGSRAAQRLGLVHARIDAMTDDLSDADYALAGKWMDSLGPAERVGIVRALAGR
jgi:hypothetical protein